MGSGSGTGQEAWDDDSRIDSRQQTSGDSGVAQQRCEQETGHASRGRSKPALQPNVRCSACRRQSCALCWRRERVSRGRRAAGRASTRNASGCFGRVGAAPAHGSCTANASLDAGGRSTSAAYSSAGSACCRTLCTVAAGFFCGPAACDDAVLEGKHASRASPRRASRRQPGSRKAGS